MALPALIGGITRAASMAGKARSATKLLPRGKKGGAIVPQERPGLTQFAGEAEKRKERARPTIDKSAFFNAPKIGDPKKSKDKMQNAENKVSTISQFIKDTNKKRKEAFKSFLQSEEDETRKEKEKDKENIASKLVKGAKNRVLAPVKSLFDSILNIIGNLILGKIAMWAIDNPKLFGNILKAIAAVADFMIDMFIKVVDIFAGIIDFGYGLVDGFRDWVEGTFGEDVAEKLDEMAPAILGFLNIAAVVGAALIALAKRKVPDAKGKKKKPKAGPDPDVNPRKRKGVTTSGGKRTGVRGALDRLADKNPFRKKPKVTGGDDFFSKASRKLDQLNPLSGGAKKVTTSGGRRTGFGGLKDKIDDLNPFKKKPQITGSGSKPGFFDNLNPFKKKPKVTGGGGPSFMDRLKKLGGDTLELGRKGVKKLEQGAEFVLEQGGRFGRFVSAQYKKVTEGLGEWAKKNSPKLTAVLDWLSEQKGILGNVGKKFKPVLQKLGKYLPFIGDALGFGLDLLAGVDWRRALIRMVTGLAIDAGFTTLMTALGVAAPFTGGASGLLATAIYGAYMATDFAAGGFGKRLGDKISDFLKIPMYAGDKALAEPKSSGSDSDVKKVTKELNKKLEEDPEFAEKVKKSTAVPGPSPKGETEKPKKVVQPKEKLVPAAPKTTPEPEKPKSKDTPPTVYPQDKLVPKGKASSNITGTNEERWKAFYAMAQKAGAKYPNLVAAQFALESGWGTALSAKNNFFGIKATASESATVSNTREVYGGESTYIDARFKNFDTPQDAVNHLVTQWYKDYKGYKGVNNAPDAFAAADQLRAEGYATDPGYSQHLKRLLKEYAGIEGSEGDIKNIPSDVARTVTPDNTPTPLSSTGSTPSSSAVKATPTLSSSSTSQSSAVQSKPQVGSQGITPLPIPVGGGAGGGRRSVSGGSGGNSLNSFYKAQLIGFLYKQG
jgi:flagellum-specific peptidoglycan hydrolase FlgJ